MSRRRFILAVIMAAQFLLMVALVALQEYKLHAWQTIRLPVEPADPIALFRGRYVDLAYDFSIPGRREMHWTDGDTIYVRLAPGPDGLWRAAGFTGTPEKQPGTAFLRGRVVGTYRPRIVADIESYFLSERQAPEIEGLPRTEYEMTVDVAVAEDGRAVLKQLYVQGIPAEDFDPRIVKPKPGTAPQPQIMAEPEESDE